MLHLKTGVNYLEDGNMLVSGEFIDKPDFAEYNKVIVPEDEAYGANCIWVNHHGQAEQIETVRVDDFPSVRRT